MTGKMFSFRVQSPSVIELLNGLADKSAFIRDAVSEKFLARVAAAAAVGTKTEDTVLEEAEVALASVDHDSTYAPEISSLEKDATRLRDGLAAIRHAIAALLDTGEDSLPDHVRTGLAGIANAAEVLVTGQDVPRGNPHGAAAGPADPAEATAAALASLDDPPRDAAPRPAL